ncbi:MAG: DNA repair protein RecN [Chloroflexi bacterium]|nr:DNA repair protein RecN [Chloroflexota bacterium]PWB71921.1 MAG: DNA repair protein RecN [Holophagae bacterium]
MLERLEITDFAVARSVVIEPGPGLTVFTGETGAGKSLVVDALAFVFGARRGREVIATGAERAVVRATVALPGGRKTIERSIALSGRTSARIDDAPATVDDLRELAAGLVDIHGQSEQLSILRPQVQLAVLDEFAGLGPQREAVAATVRELREARRQLQTLTTGARERERLVEQLRFEVDEIEGAELRPGEDEELRREQAVLGNAGRLLEDAALALEALDSAPVGEAVRAVGDLAGRDPSAGELAELATALESTASDLGRALRQYCDRVEENPERLAEVGERLDRMARLCRKYGDTVAEVIAYGRQAAEQLATLTGAGTSLEALSEREQALLRLLGERATALSRARRGAAGDLVHAIAAELEHLGMGGSTLSVGFSCEDDEAGPAVPVPDYEIVITQSPLAGEGEPHPRAFTESGVDRIEFLVSFNPGESPRPLSAVASGGETSRFLLALTTALGRSGEGRIEVLDEVDEGVGGRTGAVVGEALLRLAARHQVLCITHLPQVAAYGDRHFVVTKQTDGARTWSEVCAVAGEARVQELAAMLGGQGAENVAAARALLRRET